MILVCISIKGQPMISTKEALKPHVYYYGFDDTSLQTLKDMKYEQAINYKITAAKSLLERLLTVDYLNRDNTRINDITKAVKFNQSLLEELK